MILWFCDFLHLTVQQGPTARWARELEVLGAPWGVARQGVTSQVHPTAPAGEQGRQKDNWRQSWWRLGWYVGLKVGSGSGLVGKTRARHSSRQPSSLGLDQVPWVGTDQAAAWRVCCSSQSQTPWAGDCQVSAAWISCSYFFSTDSSLIWSIIYCKWYTGFYQSI